MKNIINEIVRTLESAEQQHPIFPDDLIHKVAIMTEESGEAMRAALNFVYVNGTKEELVTELLQTAAMCVRILKQDNMRFNERSQSPPSAIDEMMEGPTDEMNDLYEIAMHETSVMTKNGADFYYTRVPGGWILEVSDDGKDGVNPVFVPCSDL